MSELISIVFDVTDPQFPPQLLDFTWADMWPRQFVVGGSEAYFGAESIVLITRPFTAGEDAVVTWAMLQDRCHLIGTHHMSDGRDLMLLQRLYEKQSREEAHLEQRRHLARKLDEIGLSTRV